MISGFTHPNNKFTSPGRVIDRHAGTPRQFECTRPIAAEQAIGILKHMPEWNERPMAGAIAPVPITEAAREVQP
jgi:hypothetical protein